MLTIFLLLPRPFPSPAPIKMVFQFLIQTLPVGVPITFKVLVSMPCYFVIYVNEHIISACTYYSSIPCLCVARIFFNS